MKPFICACYFIFCLQSLSIGQAMEDFSALSGYNWTSQIDKADSCTNAIFERWQRDGKDIDLALVKWSKFIRFDKHADLPGKKSVLHQFDSLFPEPSSNSDLYAIRSIMSGIVLRGSHDPAGLTKMQEAIRIFKKKASINALPYLVAKCYQANSYAVLGMFDECIGSTDSLVKFCETSDGVSREIMSHIYKQNGQLHFYIDNNELASDRYITAIDIARDILPANSAYLALLEGNQCDCLTYQMLFKKSEQCYGRLFDKINDLQIVLPRYDLAILYYSSSAPMSFTNNFDQIEDYLLLCIELAKDLGQPLLISDAYDALAAAARSKGDYVKALQFSKKSIDELTDEHGKLHPLGHSKLYTYAHYASEYGEMAAADSLFELCMEHAEEWFLRSDNFSIDYFNLNSFYADHQTRKDNFNEAKRVYNALYEYTKEFNNISPTWLTYLEYYLIEDLTDETKYKQAIEELDRVFKKLYVGSNYPEFGTPHPDSLIFVDDLFDLYYLYLKNTYRLGLEEGKSHDFSHIERETAKLLRILRKMKIQGSVNSEKHTVETEHVYIFIMELYQSLYNHTKDNKFLDKLLQLSNELKSGTNEYLLQYANTQNSDTTQQNLLEQLEVLEYLEYDLSEINDHNRHMELLRQKDSIYNNIVNSRKKLYQRLDKGNQDLSTETIKQTLKAGELILDYYFNEKGVYVILISSDTVFFTSWESKYFIGKLIEDFYRAQSNLQPTDEMASQLYAALLKPIEANILQKSLVIIPYAQMFYLNFENLLIHKNNRSQFLISQHTTRQCQRLSGAMEKPLANSEVQKTIQAFTPSFTTELISSYKNQTDVDDQDQEYISLSPLTHISEKLQELKQNINLIFYEERQAQERTYFKHSPEAGVIHLASHAILDNFNPTNSHIFFTKLVETTDPSNDGRLYLSEIANQQLQAKLAILTACNTGRGGIAFGGGPNTLSSSFHLAGVPSVIHTLWSVDEFTTAEIISKFYLHAKNGLSTANALRQAKLDFIEEAPLELQHPYYWSGIILIGDDSQLIFNTPINWWLWIYLSLFALGFLWLMRSTLSNKSTVYD